MDTYFAPAQRTERRKFKNQIADVSRSPIMDTLLKTTSGILVVLNDDRQIVAMNHSFLEDLGIDDPEETLGLRLGESLKCVHAFAPPSGCGTTESCLSCGAAIAMMTAINTNKKDEQVCAILTDKNNSFSNICLVIKAHPIELDRQRWILIYAEDVTQHHFWRNLERVFFHDINNILTSLYGNAQLLELKYPEDSESVAVRMGIERMMREISMQKAFSDHRQEGFTAKKQSIPLSRIQQEVELAIDGHTSTKEVPISQSWPAQKTMIVTDPLLVSRVIQNMLINACEASEPPETVLLNTIVTEKEITWEVWNKKPIPQYIRKRIFQRHFSTKPGKGRGLGTYSMKLFGEHYLGGKVDFTSSLTDGTCFSFTLPSGQE